MPAGNGEIIATSESYATNAAARNGIESVRTNAPAAPDPGRNGRLTNLKQWCPSRRFSGCRRAHERRRSRSFYPAHRLPRSGPVVAIAPRRPPSTGRRGRRLRAGGVVHEYRKHNHHRGHHPDRALCSRLLRARPAGQVRRPSTSAWGTLTTLPHRRPHGRQTQHCDPPGVMEDPCHRRWGVSQIRRISTCSSKRPSNATSLPRSGRQVTGERTVAAPARMAPRWNPGPSHVTDPMLSGAAGLPLEAGPDWSICTYPHLPSRSLASGRSCMSIATSSLPTTPREEDPVGPSRLDAGAVI